MGTLDVEYPLVNYNFILRVDGRYDLPCRNVQGFEEKNEYEYIQEGGLNDYVHIRRKPATGPNTFQAERYVIYEADNLFTVGARFDVPIQLLVARTPGEFKSPGRSYSFKGCVVLSKQYSRLSAEESGMLTETVTIAYQEMEYKDAL